MMFQPRLESETKPGTAETPTLNPRPYPRTNPTETQEQTGADVERASLRGFLLRRRSSCFSGITDLGHLGSGCRALVQGFWVPVLSFKVLVLRRGTSVFSAEVSIISYYLIFHDTVFSQHVLYRTTIRCIILQCIALCCVRLCYTYDFILYHALTDCTICQSRSG